MDKNINTNSIFITQTEFGNNCINKITLTDIMETIPKNRSEKPMENWSDHKKIEWRWRFLKLPNDKQIVEISYIESKNKDRIYFNKSREWVKRIVDPVYDQFVVKEFYYYTDFD